MDPEDFQILYAVVKAEFDSTTYGLASQMAPRSKNGRPASSSSTSSLDSKYRYRCEKLYSLGLLKKTFSKKGELEITLFSLSDQAVCVSDGNLIIFLDDLFSLYACPHYTKCKKCQCAKGQVPSTLFKPVKVHCNGKVNTYSADDCQFLKELLSENPPSIEIKNSILKVLDLKYTPSLLQTTPQQHD